MQGGGEGGERREGGGGGDVGDVGTRSRRVDGCPPLLMEWSRVDTRVNSLYGPQIPECLVNECEREEGAFFKTIPLVT